MKMRKITALILATVLLLCSCDDPMDSPEYTTTTLGQPVIGTIATTPGATEASTEEMTPTAEDKAVQLPENIMFIETGYSAQFEILGNYLCCETYKNPNVAYDDLTSVMKFYDLDKGTLAGSVTMPDKTKVYAIYKGDGDVLCRLALEKTVEDKGGRYFENSSATIFTDFTCEIKEELTALEASVKQGSHYIAHSGKDLIHAKDGYVLVEGYRADDDLHDMKALTPSYCFPMDDNRFVYRMTGYECIPGFGFYDFDTATDTFVPDSENLMPIGYHDGKIYSYETVWDGRPQGLYATDTETLETALVAEEPFEMGNRDWIEYHMPSHGEYILIYREWYTDKEFTDRHCGIYKADIKTGEILEETELPPELLINWGVGYTGDDRFLFASDYGERGFVTFELK